MTLDTATARPHERTAWSAALVASLLLYLGFAGVDRPDTFGVNQLGQLWPPSTVALTALLLTLWALALGVVGAHPLANRTLDAVLLAGLAVGSYWVFFSVQTHFLNYDGLMYQWRFRDIPSTNGAFVTHDELLELYVHSRWWYYTNLWWGWDVPRSYRPLSCGAGVVFTWLVLRLGRRVGPSAASVFIPGMLSGAYMQLFFGEVENYTLTATVAVAYMVAADRFLKRESRLRVPAATLAVGMCFHLLFGWMLPSLLYLFWVQRRRERDARELIASAVIFAAIGISVLTYFHFNGLPVTWFISSHAGSALRMVDVWVDRTVESNYYLLQLNALYLLCPAVLLAVPLVIGKRFANDEWTRFHLILAGMMLLLQMTWKAQLGPHDDWNLLSTGAICVAMLIWRTVATSIADPRIRRIALALAVIYALHTYAWVASNHARPMPASLNVPAA